ncbi:hypothetical protein LSCM4_05962 [Leishmania orientalis]|uniref:Uncharacterized protein n=1 Tax=Leishmania orientalis TaxID=2249476 RepID=A0A836HFP0_9TRYP|nr:hypothetical protein LSCM4_05962 [Leishmania orientalis]
MPLYSDEDAVETMRLESSNTDASSGVNLSAVPFAATMRGRAAQAAARGFRKDAAPALLQRRCRVLRRRHWCVGVAVLLTVLFAAQFLSLQRVSGPVDSTAFVGIVGGEHTAPARQAVASSTTLPRLERGGTTSPPPASSEAVAAATVSQDGTGEERLSPTAEVILAAASPPSHEPVVVVSTSDNAEDGASETPADSKAPHPPVEESKTASVYTSATAGNPSSPQQQQQKPTPATHEPPKEPGEEGVRANDVLPPRPAPWAKGGGSVRLRHSFSVLTVLEGPPMTATRVAADAANRTQDKEVRLLKRAAVGLLRSGMTHHASFHEWLLVHNKVLAVAAQRGEEAAVREWWRAARGEQTAAATPSVAGMASASSLLPRVRVEGLPQASWRNPQMAKVASALLYGVRLVVTEYVILHGLCWALTGPDGLVFGSPTVMAGVTPLGRANSADSIVSHSTKDSVVQREITLALQTLSKNALTGLSTMVVNQERSGAAEDVHAYRLQVYASQEWRQPEREAALQPQLSAYLQKIRFSTTVSPSTTASAHASTSDALIPRAATSGHANATSGAEVTATSELRVQDGLPIVAYSASAHFHCQRAPLYGIRIPAPRRPRHSRHASAAPSHTTRYPMRQRRMAAPSSPLTTLCEALLASASGLGVAYAVQGLTFHRIFCHEWLQFALVPSHRALVPGAAIKSSASKAKVTGIFCKPRNATVERESDAEMEQMGMAQALGDGLCTVEWVAHLKATQLLYREMAERERWRAGVPTRSTAANANSDVAGLAPVPSAAAAVPTPALRLALSNAAGRSPYLDQYATLLFSDDSAQLSRVTGTYLAFLPNTSYALEHIRRTLSDKLASISLKYAVEQTRRFTSVKRPSDQEVVCLPSDLARVHLQAAMYNTQWFLSHLGLRCAKHKSSCLGGLFDSEERTLQNMDRYLSTTGKWSRGEFRVCMSAGVYVSDPSNELP